MLEINKKMPNYSTKSQIVISHLLIMIAGFLFISKLERSDPITLYSEINELVLLSLALISLFGYIFKKKWKFYTTLIFYSILLAQFINLDIHIYRISIEKTSRMKECILILILTCFPLFLLERKNL